MNIALLRLALNLSEINQLIREFPQFLFLSYPESSLKPISPEHWSRVEIIFGGKLLQEELKLAKQLRWIHTPSPNFSRLALHEIEKEENILLTTSREENSLQTSEFVLAAILAFSKNLWHWQEANHFPQLLWDAKWRQNMLTLKGKTFLQIGCDGSGVEIARKMKEQGCVVVAVDKERSFHPFASKNLSIKELHSILPHADIVSLHLSRTKECNHWFLNPELKLMKEGSILIICGETALFDKENKLEPDLFARLRGTLYDAPYQTPISPASKVFTLPNVIVTPEVAPRPKSHEKEAFRVFRYNLRQYVHNNFSDMKNLIDTKIILAPADEL
jgi:phosphoglycerate dehydrogenase-like enzyme